jgi:hypothetical protein
MQSTRPRPHHALRHVIEEARQVRDWEKGRARAVDRLERLGVSSDRALAWVEAWDVTTQGLDGFRRAPDYWDVGYAYAREEHRSGFAPPDLQRDELEEASWPGRESTFGGHVSERP